MNLTELGEQARDLYENRIRRIVEPGNVERYIAIDVKSGDYEVGDDYLDLSDRVIECHADAALYAMRIGHRTVGRFGWRSWQIAA